MRPANGRRSTNGAHDSVSVAHFQAEAPSTEKVPMPLTINILTGEEIGAQQLQSTQEMKAGDAERHHAERDSPCHPASDTDR